MDGWKGRLVDFRCKAKHTTVALHVRELSRINGAGRQPVT